MCFKTNQSRRDFLTTLSTTSAGLAVSSFVLPKMALAGSGVASTGRRHYFLHVNIPGGLDASYLFDARPLEMTAKGQIINYIGKEGIVHIGANGQKTIRTSITDNLMKYSDRFSIINGVVMSDTFQGHDQAANILLTGNPFGGDSFLNWHNLESKPLDYVQSGSIFTNITNSGGGMSMSPKVCKELSKKMAEINSKKTTLDYIKNNARKVQGSKSSLVNAAKRYENSIDTLPNLASKFSSVNIEIPSGTDSNNQIERLVTKTKSEINMMIELMKKGVTDVGIISMESFVDIHSPDSAKRFPEAAQGIIDALVIVFDQLSATESQDGRSMLDDTTIFISSEFSRTMRQENVDIDKSGTDHNPLTNTILVGGKGVKGGLVLGESDFATSDEQLSKAHLNLDPTKKMIMGRPFDFEKGISSKELYSTYNASQYITAQNVCNTLQRILNMPETKYFTLGRNMPKASILPWLIA